ncbi:MAG: tetratricopeptide repeat protein [Candidatus Obscuribacterales bacterium]|nr:tetratricopeptide repeat protein [Candidatus Obscuribacterales bacterium]
MNFGKISIAALSVAISLTQPLSAASSTLLQKGCREIESGNYANAVRTLSAAVRVNPQDLEARRHLSNAMIEAGMEKEALQQLNLIIRIEPANPADYCLMANAYYRIGDSQNAAGKYKQALAINQFHTAARIGLTRTLLSMGKLKSARELCLESMKLDPAYRSMYQELLNAIRTRSSSGETGELKS